MTDLTAGLSGLILLVLAALVPALVYLSWVRRSERYRTAPWGPILGAFFYGAVFATIISAFVEVALVALGTEVSATYPAPEFTFLNGSSSLGAFFLVLVIAPFVEEGFKALAVSRYSTAIRQLPDGVVFGAAVGLGFGFFETFLYGLGAWLTGGIVAGLGLIVVRSLSSVLLHGSSTAMFGYGYARGRLTPQGGAGSYYLLAVLMHSSFNALASLGAILVFLGVGSTTAEYASLLGLVLAIGYAFGAMDHARTIIRRTDFPGAEATHPRFRPPPARAGPPGSSRRP